MVGYSAHALTPPHGASVVLGTQIGRTGRRLWVGVSAVPPEAGQVIVEHYLMMKNTRATARITRSTIGLRKTAYSTPTIPSAKPYSMILEKASMAE